MRTFVYAFFVASNEDTCLVKIGKTSGQNPYQRMHKGLKAFAGLGFSITLSTKGLAGSAPKKDASVVHHGKYLDVNLSCTVFVSLRTSSISVD